MKFLKHCLCAMALSQFAIAADIEYEQRGANLWSYLSVHNGIPSNGLILETSNSVIVIDTPWNDENTAELLQWIHATIGKPVETVIVTHSHEDRSGGAKLLSDRGISLIGHELTKAIVKREQGVDLEAVVSKESPIYTTKEFEIFFPGPGHTRDNTVVWLPKQKVLHGGCAFKSASTFAIGYIKESDIIEWPKSIRAVDQRYPNADLYVPGHGPPADRATIDNTLKILENYIDANHGAACKACINE
ncbi:MAG: subclass B1 metallo-beta-lactamase [Pseudomonadota bacterium]